MSRMMLQPLTRPYSHTWDVDHSCTQAALGELSTVVDGALEGSTGADMDRGGLHAACTFKC
jgi:hypothetical protein